jgi:hypothetical protein
LQDQEVYQQEDAVDPGKRGVGAFGPDVVEPLSVFTLTEFAFNGDALQIILSLLRF